MPCGTFFGAGCRSACTEVDPTDNDWECSLSAASGSTDTIDGGNGPDNTCGETGQDYLYGGSGNDDLYGGVEDDFVIDGQGDTDACEEDDEMNCESSISSCPW